MRPTFHPGDKDLSLGAPALKRTRLLPRRKCYSLGFVSGQDFTACGKIHDGGRRGFQPPHNANQINVGFSPGRMSFVYFVCNFEFFRNLFSRAAKAAK
jgi:hypothetical protein